MTTNRYKRTCGFTLLEIMIALAILTVALLAVFRLHAQTISMNNRAKFNLTAPLLAQSKLSELEAKSFTGTDEEGNFGEQFSGYTWKVAISDTESEFIGQLAENLKRIDFTVFLNNDEFAYSLRTYVFISE